MLPGKEKEIPGERMENKTVLKGEISGLKPRNFLWHTEGERRGEKRKRDEGMEEVDDGGREESKVESCGPVHPVSTEGLYVCSSPLMKDDQTYLFLF